MFLGYSERGEIARMGVPGRAPPEQNVVRAEGLEPSWAV